MFTVLVVEDEKDLRELFCTVLNDQGYRTLSAANGMDALKQIDSHYVDLIISDIMMPKMDGYTLTRSLREANYTQPILMITAKDSMLDKQEGFRVGTDDYMVKPVDLNEMIWRVRALLRRAQAVNQRILHVGGTVLSCDALSVSREGEVIELPQKEFYLLFKLLSSVGRIFTRRQIVDEIWGVEYDADLHTLDVHISRLREKFKGNPDFEIVTVRGLGYKAVKKDE